MLWSILVKYASNLSPALSIRFPMVLVDTAGVTCSWVSSLDAVRAVTDVRIMHRCWHESILRSRSEPDLWVLACSTEHLIKTATRHSYIAPNMCRNPSLGQFSFPRAKNFISFKCSIWVRTCQWDIPWWQRSQSLRVLQFLPPVFLYFSVTLML